MLKATYREKKSTVKSDSKTKANPFSVISSQSSMLLSLFLHCLALTFWLFCVYCFCLSPPNIQLIFFVYVFWNLITFKFVFGVLKLPFLFYVLMRCKCLGWDLHFTAINKQISKKTKNPPTKCISYREKLTRQLIKFEVIYLYIENKRMI